MWAAVFTAMVFQEEGYEFPPSPSGRAIRDPLDFCVTFVVDSSADYRLEALNRIWPLLSEQERCYLNRLLTS